LTLVLALAAAGPLGRLAYAAGGSTRDAARRRIAETLGVDAAEADRVCRGMYRNFALGVLDLLIFSGWRKRALGRAVEVEGFEHVTEAIAGGRGVVGITGHLSNWELLGGYVASRLGGIAVLATPAYDRNFDRAARLARRRLDVRTIYRTEPPAVPLGWLRDGRFLGTVADQDISDVPGVVVDFLGRPARTPVGPALFARRAGAPLVPIFIIRKDDNNYRIVTEPPVATSTAPRVKDALREDTAAWSAALGKWVARYPEQWVWVHDRWSRAAEADGE
jgi:KDO2-lipid IV(A) lauroyltransferase